MKLSMVAGVAAVAVSTAAVGVAAESAFGAGPSLVQPVSNAVAATVAKAEIRAFIISTSPPMGRSGV
jgi:hypothetical protein